MFRHLLFGIAVALLASPWGAAAPSAPVDETTGLVMQMSPYEVSANSVDFQHWIKVGSPNYILYTDAGMKEATRILRESEMLHLATQRFFHRQTLALRPAIIVLPTSNSDWKKIAAKGHVEWEVAVSESDNRVVRLISVQYDWQEEGISILHSPQGRREMEALNLVGPFWFNYGMGKFFETVEFTRDTVTLGRQNDRMNSLARGGWIPWPRFFQITSESPEYTREYQVHRFVGQCTAFLQYLITNEDPAKVEQLLKWVALLDADGDPTEEKFKSVFGKDWKAWQLTMENYLAGGRYRVTSLRIAPEGLDFPLKKFDLPVKEMRELFVLSQIINQKTDVSKAALETIVARGLKTESLREVLAEACLVWERNDIALAELRRVAAAGSTNPLVYTTLANGIFDAHIPKITVDARLGEEAAEIRALCRKALAIEPHHPAANNLLAWTEALGPRMDAESAAAIEKIYQIQQGNAAMGQIVTALAVAKWRAGDAAWAKTVSQTLLTSPLVDKPSKEIAAALVAKIGTVP